MAYFRRKILFMLLVLCLSLCSYYQLYMYVSNDAIEKVSRSVSILKPRGSHRHVERGEKLVTIFTTFVDVTHLPNSQYRHFVQSNFLRMTNFDCFRQNANFIVFTNSRIFKILIAREYPTVLLLPSPMRGDFSTPMLKDLFLIAEKSYSSLFYMFANADNIYDSSLIHTLFHVRNAWRTGLIRQKVLIFGQKNNLVIQEEVENETAFLNYFKRSVLFTDIAQDYFIVTRDSIEWLIYPEVLVGRRAYDNMLVDFGVHNEMESIDATETIRLIHQSEENTNHSAFDKRNELENNWNVKLVKFQNNHCSTTCARYRTEFDVLLPNKVKLFDKKTGLVLLDPIGRASDYFSKNHKYWVDFVEHEVRRHIPLTPSLVVVVLAYNKPDSLRRLLRSLINIGDSTARIDLIISLDMGYLGYYDLPTLIIARQFDWIHGRKKLVLKSKHRGQLYQWLEAYDSVVHETRVLILEDSMVMSPQWYEYISTVLSHDRVRVLHDVAGWTLETPIVRQSPGYAVNMFYRLYAGRSSLVLSGIKRVRSFIPNNKIWKGFIIWYREESKNIANELLSSSLAARLENRGTYTEWESEMWVTWFSYYIKTNYPEHQKFGYIIKRSGFLCVKMQVTFLEKWGKNGNGCFRDEVLIIEMGIQSVNIVVRNDSILIPEVIPTFKIESMLSRPNP